MSVKEFLSITEKVKKIFPAENDVPEEYRLSDAICQTEYLINGEIKHWQGKTINTVSPICIKKEDCACQQRLGCYPALSKEEALKCLDGCVKAYDNGRGQWPTMSVAQRIKCVEEFTYRMQQKKKEIVNLLMWEIGKTYKDSEKEFDRTVEYIKDTIDALKELDRVGSRFVIEQGVIGKIRRSPLGVVLSMGPYNYPLNETFTTLIPALIMGNTIIFKPPSIGVLIFRPLLEDFRDCFPAGVINTVYGEGKEVIPPLMESGRVDVLAFIGSTRVADLLKSKHPQPHKLRSVLGLAAKNPAIILPDADLDSTVKECLLGTLSYNGQRCTALKILFVHKSIVEPFLKKFSQAVSGLKPGMPWEKDVDITPMPEPGKADYLTDLVEDAKKLGAKVINQDGGLTNGNFFYPAILYPVNPQMKVYHEEQFGPVIPVLAFDDVSEPLNYIAESRYGQQVSLFGQNIDELASLIDPLVNQVSRVNINSQCQRGPDTFPFTGRKDSAEGTLSVTDALKVFSIRALVTAKQTDLNKEIITEVIRQRKSNFLSTDYIL